MSIRPLLLLLPLLAVGCSRAEPTVESVSADPLLQARFAAAVRSLEEIRARQKNGVSPFADCKTVEMLFFRDLERLAAPAAKRVLGELREACRGILPATKPPPK